MFPVLTAAGEKTRPFANVDCGCVLWVNRMDVVVSVDDATDDLG